MRTPRPVSSLRNQRGQIIIFVMLSLVFLLVVAGFFGSDAARLVSDKGEMQAALDAAALAGAGKLGFDNSVFPTARDFAVNFATLNQNRSGVITLDRNDANNVTGFDTATMPYGDVLLGLWDPAKPDGIGPGLRFEPSLDALRVNSVMCRYKRQIPASFLSLWGLVNMTVATSAVATSNPPAFPPDDACVFPIGVSVCAFQGPTAKGCGTVITMSTSNGNLPLTQAGGNTAAWVSITEATANAEAIKEQIVNSLTGNCQKPPGTTLDANNGKMQSAYTELATRFPALFNASEVQTVYKTESDGTKTAMYTGQGLKVAVPIIDTPCGVDGVPTTLNDTYPIAGWTYFYMTQVIDRGNCTVTNTADANTRDLCEALKADPTKVPDGKGGTVNLNSLNAAFGYYDCGKINTSPLPHPAPRGALATKLRLVR
jgi:putative Flp pilus-assembly TadE/G-like protein